MNLSSAHADIKRKLRFERLLYMSFFRHDGWVCGFPEADCKTPVGRIRTFSSADKVLELIQRTPTQMDQAAKQAVEHAFGMGKGGVWLELTGDSTES